MSDYETSLKELQNETLVKLLYNLFTFIYVMMVWFGLEKTRPTILIIHQSFLYIILSIIKVTVYMRSWLSPFH